MRKRIPTEKQIVIIGGGPAGLTAAYELTKFDFQPIVLEKQDKVGGLACTENYRGYYFDMGGHRFFTKVEQIDKMWHEVMEDDFLLRPRLSRIYYNDKFFYYPLKPFNVLLNLGFWESLRIILSYLKWQIFPYRSEKTFEQWVTNRFGKRLFLTFFKSYTEKIWGISCSDLSAEWAAQRIKDLSLKTALFTMFLKPQKTIKTLIEEFGYPRRGPGMMWSAVKKVVEQRRGVVRLNSKVIRIERTANHIDGVVISYNGREEVIEGTDFISSMPLMEFIENLDPPPPITVLRAAKKLEYRAFLTVCLIINQPDLFPDNWIYIHDPSVKVGRIQNCKNWSPDMVPDLIKTSLGLEYFCNEGDELWMMEDADLIELGKHELESIGLARYEAIEDGCVFRVPKSYPIYNPDYQNNLSIVREFIDGLENFQTIGRNGLHRYNNMDHSMLSGLLAVRNVTLGEKNDLWRVNTDQAYHEEIFGKAREEELIEVVQEILTHVFPKLDRTAFGLALGSTTGLILFLATLWLVLKGGNVIGPNLQLLGQYFPGYRVSFWGSMFGLAYGFATGFVGGWCYAFLRNVMVLLSMALIHRRAQWQLLRKLFDYL